MHFILIVMLAYFNAAGTTSVGPYDSAQSCQRQADLMLKQKGVAYAYCVQVDH